VRQPGSGGARVSTVPVVSSDGNAVYFTASGRLTTDAPTVTGEEVDLYRYDTVTQQTSFITVIDERDYPRTDTSEWGEQEPELIALEPSNNWYTTPDGKYLLFATTHEVPAVGYNSTAAPGTRCNTLQGISSNGRCFELYRYDAGDGAIECVSCDPNGARPVSNGDFATNSAGSDPSSGAVRAMSDDGSYVFFDSGDALVPQDSNGVGDVYEWHEGVVSLISSGLDAAPSFFLGSSARGHDVFFGTHARLVLQDRDSARDLYDARICEPANGNPCIAPPPGEAAQCEGDACQSPPPAPIDSTPASLTFAGGEDLVASTAPVVKAPSPRNAALSKALASCKRQPRKLRKGCEAKARKRYAKRALRSESRRMDRRRRRGAR